MADFAVSIVAAESALDVSEGAFLKAYLSNRSEAQATAVDTSIVGTALRDFMSSHELWSGTAGELLAAVSAFAGEECRAKGFPKTPSALSNAVRRVADGLASLGIRVEFLPRQNSRRPIRITREVQGEAPSQPSPLSPVARDQWIESDDSGDGEPIDRDGVPGECDRGDRGPSRGNFLNSNNRACRDGGDSAFRAVSDDEVGCAIHDVHRPSWRISPHGVVVCLECHPNPAAARWPRA
jgi:hypothetical protein